MKDKVNEVLPASLIEEIQQYIQGETIYIPKKKDTYHKWGTRSGGRKELDERNDSIRKKFHKGVSITRLSDDYALSTESIKKIVYIKHNK
ncbi:CD3324 family protein [Halobacillus salinus]|uniref:CD3324 family protein n=1 Tax=Halobacillus salinus TaxID=192814 RepID=UPI003F644AC9